MGNYWHLFAREGREAVVVETNTLTTKLTAKEEGVSAPIQFGCTIHTLPTACFFQYT